MKKRILAIILSGGQGRRASYQDKGLISVNGVKLVDMVTSKIEPQVDEICISANRNLQTYQQKGYPVFSDEINKHLNEKNNIYNGPLSGIYSSLTALQEKINTFDAILLCPCDTPFLPIDYVSKLSSALFFEPENFDVSLVWDGKRNQNLHALIKTQCIESLLDFYRQDGRAIKEWYEIKRVSLVDYSQHANSFKNLNTL